MSLHEADPEIQASLKSQDLTHQSLQQLAQQKHQQIPQRTLCSTDKHACQTNVSFAPRFVHHGVEHLMWKQPCEIAPRDPRLWVGDLRPIHYEHNILHGSLWHPEPYSHVNARQLHLQYLDSTLWHRKPDPNTKKIDSIDEAYCVLKNKIPCNEVQFTSF